MTKKTFIYVVMLCFTAIGFSQITKNDILFTVDEEPVKATEFLRVYNKNLDLVKDESQKDVDAYLELFINYQLKVKEAKRLGLDQEAQYIREFGNYKKQLTKNYLSDNKVTDALVEEAYNRSVQDVKASHILVRIDETETDTLKVYNEILDLRQRLINEGFDKLQKEVHDGQNIFAEDLGYFSAFRMVYPFETAAYNTKVGEVSMPFRTRFGYHVVLVQDKRPSRGEVTVAHIMISNNQKDSLLNPETRIKEIYKKIEQGENFESLAKQFSDDKSSSSKGGLMSPFTGGQLSSIEFENVAFGLKNKDEISKPFKTDYGWHIIKLIDKKGVPNFKEVKAELEQRVKRDSRSSLINSALVNKLKNTYNFTESSDGLSYFESIINDDFFKRSWVIPTNLDKDKMLFKIRDKAYTYFNFAEYLLKLQNVYFNKQLSVKDMLKKEYNNYIEKSVLEYHEENLEFENEDFAHVLKEYRDGLLLFDLMEKEVWNAAVKDTLGLKDFYNKHKNDYTWQDRADAVVITAAKKKDIEKVIDLLNKNVNVDEINEQLNSDKEQKVIITKGIMDAEHQALPKDFEFKEGVSDIYNYNDAYHVVYVYKLMPKGLKTFDEAKGKIVSDYQNAIEENWLKELNSRYKVKVNKDVLAKVKSQIESKN